MLLTVLTVMVAVLAASCSSGSSLPPADELPELEFGSGELPITVPEDFPFPERSVIQGTMIDGTRTLTEVVFTVGEAFAATVAFYELSLPDGGYEITGTDTQGVRTVISFVGHGIDGTVTIAAAGPGLSEGFLVFVYA